MTHCAIHGDADVATLIATVSDPLNMVLQYLLQQYIHPLHMALQHLLQQYIHPLNCIAICHCNATCPVSAQFLPASILQCLVTTCPLYVLLQHSHLQHIVPVVGNKIYQLAGG